MQAIMVDPVFAKVSLWALIYLSVHSRMRGDEGARHVNNAFADQ